MSSSSSGPPSHTLQRGRACGNCRRRKIKCDGRRPVCGPCERNIKTVDDCQYADSGPTRTQMLEEDVAFLQARVRELEGRGDDHNSLFHNPYVDSLQHERRTYSMPALPHQADDLGSAFIPYPSGSTSDPNRSSPAMSSPALSTSDQSVIEEPSSASIHRLLENFLPHASEFGFFLNPTRFQTSVLFPPSFGPYSRPVPALLNAVYLWGVRCSQSENRDSHESLFLSRALLHLPHTLASDHPYKVIHAIQTEVLLCLYFFSCRRTIEGKYHLSGALSLVLGSELHQLRTSNQPARHIDLVESWNPLSMPPQDQIEEGERINAFWTVYSLNNCWGIHASSPTSTLLEGSHIDTPWPLDTEQYEQNFLAPNVRSSNTVKAFLDRVPSSSVGEFSTLALYAKASILFERASSLTSKFRANMDPGEAIPLASAFSSLDKLIDAFKAILPPVEQLDMTMPSIVRSTFVTHTLTSAATIQLHTFLSETDDSSHQKYVAAAEFIFALIPKVDLLSFGQVNPFLGPIWTRACQVIIREIARLRSLHSGWSPTISQNRERELADMLERAFGAMALFSMESHLMSYQLTKIQEQYSSLQRM